MRPRYSERFEQMMREERGPPASTRALLEELAQTQPGPWGVLPKA